jgi:hypothetical protein
LHATSLQGFATGIGEEAASPNDAPITFGCSAGLAASSPFLTIAGVIPNPDNNVSSNFDLVFTVVGMRDPRGKVDPPS